MGAFANSVGGVSLAETNLLDGEQQARLEALSISTVEELLSAARAAPDALSQFLGVDVAQLGADAGLEAGPALMRVAAFEQEFEGAYFVLGAVPPPGVEVEEVALESTFEQMVAELAQSPIPEGEGRTLSCHGPVRNQGDRGTCVGHAGAAVFECLHHAATGEVIDLSPQFLFYNAKMADGSPTQDGTWSEKALPTLVTDGICLETAWPYQSDKRPGDVHHGPPPGAAKADALNHKATRVDALNPRDSAAIRAEIDAGRPVTISLPVYQNWWGPVTKQTGKFPMPLPNALVDGGHAMCVTGYDFDETFTGGGYFVLRNSWGDSWAPQSPIAPGYGAIPFEYIDRYGWEAFTLAL